MVGVVALRKVLALPVGVLALFGAAAVPGALFAAVQPTARPFLLDLCYLAFAFAALAPWSVRLPSGAAWRPAMAMVTASLFLLPPVLTPLVAVPGLVIITARSGGAWQAYPLTFGHVAAGLYAGGVVYRFLASAGPLRLPEMLPAAAAALVVHLAVNRLLSAVIVAHREGRPLLKQMKATREELTWGHFGMHLMGLVTALLFQAHSVWGLALATSLMVGFYQSVSYYTKMQVWQQAAWTDGLTSAGNRAAWENFRGQARRRKPSGTLAVIDLDDFKQVNDEFGHQTGDQVLQELANSILRSIRQNDRLFRYGGDEFILFLEHAPNLHDAVHERLRRVVDDLTANWSARGMRVRPSLGVAAIPQEAATFEEAFRIADNRMYAIKSAHKTASPA